MYFKFFFENGKQIIGLKRPLGSNKDYIKPIFNVINKKRIQWKKKHALSLYKVFINL
jgi:hypothetical protein